MRAVSARPVFGDPAWDIAHLYPAQGTWSEGEYLLLPDHRRVELSNGFIEVLPAATTSHQMIIAILLEALVAFVEPRELGTVLFTGLRVRLGKGKIREPDLVFMRADHAERMGEEYWHGADLVMEVVSGGDKDRKRDLEIKPKEYARGHIPEYWILDPQEHEITVLRLRGSKYVVHGRFERGEQATSALLKGFAVDVDSVLSVKKRRDP